ncbi:MAG TPA: hypothetical protein VMU95_29335 [Trebonia sp.]|nr:hypothetical protein [Trebonia sp.]
MFRRRSQTEFSAKIGTGLTLLQGGDRAGALRLFAEISHSNDPNVLRGLGLAYQQAGEMQFAEHVIRRALAAGSRDALNDLGVLLKRTGRPAEAEQALRQASDAGDPNAMNNLGNLFSERGDQQGATWFWHRAAEAGNPRAMVSLGMYLASTGHPEARRWYDRAVTKLPEAPDIREQLDALAAAVSGQPGAHPVPPIAPGTPVPSYSAPPPAVPLMATPSPAWSPQPVWSPPPAWSPAPAWSPPPASPAPAHTPPIPPGPPATPSPSATPSPPATPSPSATPSPPGTPAPYSPAPVTPSPAQSALTLSQQSPALPNPAPMPPPAAIGAWAESSSDGDPGAQTSATVHRPRSNPRLGAASPPPAPDEAPAQPEAAEETRTGSVATAEAAAPAPDITADPGNFGPPPASLLPAGPPPAGLMPAGPPRAIPTLEPPTLFARAVLPTPPPEQVGAVDVPETLRTADRLREEYLATGNPGKLGQALEASQLAADSVPAGDLATRGLVLGLRCALLRLAYQRDKDQTKLAEAIEAGRAAKSLVRPTDPSFSRTLTSLASALQEEYARTRNPAILTEALALYRDGVQVLPEGHPELAGLHANICNVLMTQGLQEPRLLADAVEAGRQAVALSDPDSPAYAARLASLGMALVAHHANNRGPQSELDEAERLFSQALTALPADHALRAQIQGYLDAATAIRQRPQ